MKKLKLFFLLSILFLSSTVQGQFLKLRTGNYNEPGNVKRHPYTIFYRANESDQALEDQIEAIRDEVKKGQGEFFTVYDEIYKFADNNTSFPQGGFGSTHCPGGSDQCISKRSKLAKNAAFVYLLGFDANGDDLTQSERETFRERAKGSLRGMNTRFPANYKTIWKRDQYQWRGKELIMYVQAYDLLKAGAARHGDHLPMDYERKKLITLTKKIYKRGVNALRSGNNHSIIAASAIGMAAVVLNTNKASWLNVSKQPRRWAHNAHYWLDEALWDYQSTRGKSDGYAEGPHYFMYCFEVALPFFRAMSNFKPIDDERNYFKKRSFFGAHESGSKRRVRNFNYDPDYDNLYLWVKNIVQHDGTLPPYDDTWNDGSDFPAIMAIQTGMEQGWDSEDRGRYSVKFGEMRPTISSQWYDGRADWLAALNPGVTSTEATNISLPESGDVILRTPHHAPIDSALYLRVGAESGRTTNGESHEHNDAGGLIPSKQVALN